MKKILSLFLVLSSLPVLASSYLTLCESDTLRISPTHLQQYVILPVIANFEGGVADHWRLEVTHPNALRLNEDAFDDIPDDTTNGMHIPYVKSDGTEDVYAAVLTLIQQEQSVSDYAKCTIMESTIPIQGYWDYDHDGNYECYGTVKWGPGHYGRMFDFHFYLANDCSGDSIVINGLMTSTQDWRYNQINCFFYKVIHLSVRYLKGDVNGDEVVNINDVTALIDHLTNNLQDMDQYQLEAADVNNNGVVNIADVTALIDLLS